MPDLSDTKNIEGVIDSCNPPAIPGGVGALTDNNDAGKEGEQQRGRRYSLVWREVTAYVLIPPILFFSSYGNALAKFVYENFSNIKPISGPAVAGSDSYSAANAGEPIDSGVIQEIAEKPAYEGGQVKYALLGSEWIIIPLLAAIISSIGCGGRSGTEKGSGTENNTVDWDEHLDSNTLTDGNSVVIDPNKIIYDPNYVITDPNGVVTDPNYVITDPNKTIIYSNPNNILIDQNGVYINPNDIKNEEQPPEETPWDGWFRRIKIMYENGHKKTQDFIASLKSLYNSMRG